MKFAVLMSRRKFANMNGLLEECYEKLPAVSLYDPGRAMQASSFKIWRNPRLHRLAGSAAWTEHRRCYVAFSRPLTVQGGRRQGPQMRILAVRKMFSTEFKSSSI